MKLMSASNGEVSRKCFIEKKNTNLQKSSTEIPLNFVKNPWITYISIVDDFLQMLYEYFDLPGDYSFQFLIT